MSKRNIIPGMFCCLLVSLLTGCFSSPAYYTSSGFQVNDRKTVLLEIESGNVILKIDGIMTEDLYRIKDEDKYKIGGEKTLAIKKGTILIDKELALSAGDKYRYSLRGAGAITIQCTGISENGTTIISKYDGKTEEHKINKYDILDIMLFFQN
ncbi:hypothetical protein [Breznakiella homolactica]|uniref:Lipoprotein n=1 Tax=Breznakiella homolactica TaxID=2798577 RepID=A0A7T7XQG2_9SPIR|nr:hypothetical protein [Breznakiella homolactica]QQO10604.1 hypothetical protein JFL75_06725 [Breznakiella homolactica]